MTDHKDLKEWVKWAKAQPEMADEQPLFIKAIEDAVSQAGMVSQLRADLATERAANQTLLQGPTVSELRAEIQTLKRDIDSLNMGANAVIAQRDALQSKLTQEKELREADVKALNHVCAKLEQAETDILRLVRDKATLETKQAPTPKWVDKETGKPLKSEPAYNSDVALTDGVLVGVSNAVNAHAQQDYSCMDCARKNQECPHAPAKEPK